MHSPNLPDVRLWQSTTADLELNAASINQLRAASHEGCLRIFVGAGLSVAAGFPSWDILLRRLLDAIVRAKSQMLLQPNPHATPHDKEFLAELATRRVPDLPPEQLEGLLQRIGEGAPGDLARMVWGKEFEYHLSSILYGPIASEERRRRTDKINANAAAMFRQLAAMAWANGCSLYTTNYDDQLERALSYIGHRKLTTDPTYSATSTWGHLHFVKDGFRSLHAPGGSTLPSVDPKHPWLPPDHPLVTHLHGFLSPTCNAGVFCSDAPLVLSDADYHGAASQVGPTPLHAMRQVLNTPKGATLILGMSLLDPNLRSVLINSLPGNQSRQSHNNVYAVVKHDSSGYDAWLQYYYSKALGVTLIPVRDFTSQPVILRKLRRYAGTSASPSQALEWWPTSTQWVRRMEFDSPQAAVATEYVLTCVRQQIRTRFALDPAEVIHLELLVPDTQAHGSAPRLKLLACSVTEEQAVGTERAARYLRLLGEGGTQGVGGMSFLMGCVMSCVGGEGGVDINLTAQERASWGPHGALREFVSTMAVTVLDTWEWVPVCTICISSNKRVPFWARNDHAGSDRHLLEMLIRSLPAKIGDVLKRETPPKTTTAAGGSATVGPRNPKLKTVAGKKKSGAPPAKAKNAPE